MYDDEIVAITEVVSRFQYVFRKPVEFVKVYVREQLARHVTKRQSFSLLFFKTSDNHICKPQRVRIGDLFGDDPSQDTVIYRIEEPSHIAFQHIRRNLPIHGFLATCTKQTRYTTMRALGNTR